MRSKAFLSLILALLCFLSLSGCSADNPLSFPDRENTDDFTNKGESGNASASAQIVSASDLQALYDNMEIGVWITETGSKYHSRENCSGAKTARFISLEEAESLGFKPCSKCFE